MTTLVLTVLTALTAPVHLGALHGYERFLVWLIAFGPFIVLAVVVYAVRRRDLAADDDDSPP